MATSSLKPLILSESGTDRGETGLGGDLASSRTCKKTSVAQVEVIQRDASVPPDATKTYFKLLQAIHHAEIVNRSLETNSFPKGMTNKINKMTSFIKRSSPNLNNLEKVILRDHYDSVISSNLLNIPQFQLEAFNRALKWVRARYAHKLTSSLIETLRSMIMTPYKGEFSPYVAADVHDKDFPPLPPPAREMPAVHRPGVVTRCHTPPVIDRNRLVNSTSNGKIPITTLATIEIRPTSPKPQRTLRTFDRTDGKEEVKPSSDCKKISMESDQIKINQTLHLKKPKILLHPVEVNDSSLPKSPKQIEIEGECRTPHPQSLEDSSTYQVVGNEKITSILQPSITNEVIPH